MNPIQNLKYKVLDAGNYVTEHRFDFVQFYHTNNLLNEINNMLQLGNTIKLTPQKNSDNHCELTLGGIINGKTISDTEVTSAIKYAIPDDPGQKLTDFITIMENKYVNKKVINKLKKFLLLNYHVEKYSHKLVKNNLPTFV